MSFEAVEETVSNTETLGRVILDTPGRFRSGLRIVRDLAVLGIQGAIIARTLRDGKITLVEGVEDTALIKGALRTADRLQQHVGGTISGEGLAEVSRRTTKLLRGVAHI